jgi:hypothetical protein
MGFAQAQPIPGANYWAAIRSSNDNAKALAYRKIVKDQSFEGDVEKDSDEEVYEHLPNGDFKQILTNISKGTKFTREFIKVGNLYYCRDDGKEWNKSDKWCGPRNYRTIPAGAKMEFSREAIGSGKKVIQLYRMYATYTLSGQTPHHNQFYESKNWVDNLGRITKAETRVGTAESNHRLFLTSEQYEYETAKLKIKIEAPIP